MTFGTLLRFVSSATVLTASLAVTLSSASPVNATTLDATGATFQFGVTGQTVTGAALETALPVGSSILYSAVATISGTVIDGKVTIVRGENLTGSSSNPNNFPNHIRRLDRGLDSAPSRPYLEHSIAKLASQNEAMAEIRVEFFLAGTTTPVTLSHLVAHFYDVDNRQSVEVDGVQSYSLAPNTILTTTSASSGAVRFSELNNVSTSNVSTSGGSSYTIGRASGWCPVLWWK